MDASALRSAGPGEHRHSEGEGAAGPDPGVDPDPATVSGNDLLAGREPKPAAPSVARSRRIRAQEGRAVKRVLGATLQGIGGSQR
jgi:hypothetical protein